MCANFFRLGQPLVFRVHEGPNADRLLALNEALLALHLEPLPADGDFNPKAMQKLLHSVEGLPTAEFVQVMALRSMSHASYAPKRSLHFGLAAKFYCHFTSPIRRYPDLLVHRVIKNALTAGLPANSGEDCCPGGKNAGRLTWKRRPCNPASASCEQRRLNGRPSS